VVKHVGAVELRVVATSVLAVAADVVLVAHHLPELDLKSLEKNLYSSPSVGALYGMSRRLSSLKRHLKEQRWQ
jgi:hypothetical protein